MRYQLKHDCNANSINTGASHSLESSEYNSNYRLVIHQISRFQSENIQLGHGIGGAASTREHDEDKNRSEDRDLSAKYVTKFGPND